MAIGKADYRDEELGLAYEDFEVGQMFRHRPGRTISEVDNTWFSLLTLNAHPLHIDAAFASHHEFGRLTVNSCLTLSIIVGMSVRDISQRAIANLGWNDIRLTHPVFVGDTLYASSTILAKRESQKRPEAGIVTVRTIGETAAGDQVISFERTMLLAKRTCT